jgi:hypothetical protein
VSAISALVDQRITYLGAIDRDAEQCYLGAKVYDVEQKIKNRIKSSSGLNIIIFQKRVKI